jgi:sulfite exporter TauE/SafE
MFLIGLGALLVLCGVLYMVRAVIWRGSLSGPDSGRPVRDTLEPPTRSMRFLGIRTNWPGILLMAIGAVLLLSGVARP